MNRREFTRTLGMGFLSILLTPVSKVTAQPIHIKDRVYNGNRFGGIDFGQYTFENVVFINCYFEKCKTVFTGKVKEISWCEFKDCYTTYPGDPDSYVIELKEGCIS